MGHLEKQGEQVRFSSHQISAIPGQVLCTTAHSRRQRRFAFSAASLGAFLIRIARDSSERLKRLMPSLLLVFLVTQPQRIEGFRPCDASSDSVVRSRAQIGLSSVFLPQSFQALSLSRRARRPESSWAGPRCQREPSRALRAQAQEWPYGPYGPSWTRSRFARHEK